jgi:hypothetical protein
VHQPRDHTRGHKKRPFSLTHGRLSEIAKLIRYRNVVQCRACMPAKEGELYLVPLCQHLHRSLLKSGFPPTAERLRSTLEWWANRLLPATLSDSPDALTKAIGRTLRHNKTDGAAALGVKLKLTDNERTQCRIKTIAAFDITQAEREERRRQKKRAADRTKAEAKRRALGLYTRAEYRANSLTAEAPWMKEGICRRTWERRRKRGG